MMASMVSLPQLIAALYLAACILLIKLLWRAQMSPLSKLPGPWYSKYTNIILRFHTLSGRRIFYVDELHQRYGGVVRIAPNEVAIADLAGVSQIHKVSSGFLKSTFYSNLTPDQNPGIFAMRDPYAHAARRKLFARAFSNSSLKTYWDTEVRRKVTLAVQKIKQDALGKEKGADILKWWTLMATDVIAHLSFGESFDMLNLGEQTSYITALQNALLDGVLHAEAPLLYAVIRYVPLKKVQDIVKATIEINRHGEIAVRNMRQSGGNTVNLFSQIVAASEGEQKVSLTDKDVKEEAGNLIVAGSDTTAVTLTYLVWAVLKQPELQSQLEHEVSQFSDDLDNAELEAAPLLNSVIEETLRLYGAAPGALPRIVPSQGATIGGHRIPGGVEVSTQAYTNHRDPSIFPNPLQFDGYRFMNKSEMPSLQKAAYMPFGGGSRVCLGIHLAYMELRLSAALFFRQCRGARISESMKDEMMEMDNRFLIAPKGHCCYITMR